MNDDIDIDKLGELKLHELSPEQVDVVQYMLNERLEETKRQIEHYEAILRLEDKKRKKGHFFYACRERGKYGCADIRNHVDQKRPDSPDVQFDAGSC